MKTFCIAILATLTGIASAHAACPQNADVQYAVTYLALAQGQMWNGGLGSVGTYASSDELCAKLKTYSVLQSKFEGYHEVVLNLETETCTLQVKPADHGKYADAFLQSCEK